MIPINLFGEWVSGCINCSHLAASWQGDNIMAKTEALNTTEVDAKVLEEILQSIKSVKYGTITITVHEGKVTQLETSRKLRF